MTRGISGTRAGRPAAETRVVGPGFYLRPTLDVAPDLLGKILCRRIGSAVLLGRIVEVEAYHQDGDAASHSHRGRTARNAVMFDEGGRLYVYFTYGMHYCMNVVTECGGIGAAVLIRGLEPLDGIVLMRRHRGPHRADRDLTNGPAKCCQAFAIDTRLNGASLQGPGIMILDAPAPPASRIVRTPRIGIRCATDLPWRFLVDGNPFVSHRPSQHTDVPAES